MNELKKGSLVEREHKGTYKFIEKRFKQTGNIPSFKEVTKSIAKDHLKEDKNYYQKLKTCKL
jgi:hypothetical protein